MIIAGSLYRLKSHINIFEDCKKEAYIKTIQDGEIFVALENKKGSCRMLTSHGLVRSARIFHLLNLQTFIEKIG